LERRYGKDAVRAAYERLSGGETSHRLNHRRTGCASMPLQFDHPGKNNLMLLYFCFQ
jgi:hypothetical protein